MAITIENGARVLYRWERGVALTVTKPCDILRLYREDDRVGVELTPTWSGSTGSVTIPDRMLTESGYLHAARVEKADGEERIIETARFLVRDAQKPGNHAASSKEVRDWETLKLQMEALERAAREGEFDGADGITPHVGENGNWFIGDVDTGVHAQGDPGDTPYIGENGYWYIGETDTGVRAKGENGITPHIGANGNWFIGEYDTGVHAQGDPGITPHIGENGNWFIGEYDTGVLARNEDVSFYADDLLTSGILGEGAMSLEILAPEGSNVIRYRIDSAVVYVKGVRRARGAFSVNRQAVGHERLIANVLRYDEAKGSFSWTLGEVVRDGEVFVNVDNGEIYPTRSDGYYDLVPYLVHIPAGATSITIEQVEDLRADERYCGYVRSRIAPTKVSELENDSGYVTGDQIENVITTEPQELTDAEKAQARANIGAAAAGEGGGSGGGITEITSDMVVDALGYIPADAAGVDKLSEAVVNVTPQMFGAVGDGVTDDTAAFVDAIQNANGKLYIPSGNYLITSTLTVDKQIMIEGNGCENTTLTYTGDGYLFDISTDSRNRAVIRGFKAYGSETNSFINCANGKWGACFTIEECYIVRFDDRVFNFVSAFGTNARNLRIISRGIINAEPYDSSKPFGDTITNVHNWQNVYYGGNVAEGEAKVAMTLFRFDNVQYFTLYGCSFEKIETVFDLKNHAQEIALYGCNIEQTINLYTKDSTSKVPTFVMTNTSVERFDADSDLLDALKTEPERATVLYVRDGTENLMNDIFDNENVTLLEKTAYSANSTVKYNSLLLFRTHGSRFGMPLNLNRAVYRNTKTVSYSLYNLFDLNVGFMVDVDALMIYSDGSKRWIKSSVFGQHITNTCIGRTEIMSVTEDGTVADKDTGVFSMDGSNLVLDSDYTCSTIILVVRYNTAGRPLFH